ncbi:uncharacterized protein C19orf44-like isoform X2 [Acanthaster planci]|uniref:Uncharacterized protein C19orf44-like isoform X2 n=1 Tax=Acanthaster planci TaxID=133434 RepID=A0A8B7Y9X6_ACAPL|nr:uncharacterized protein C19orf44-like isoform X2 [Acanthaster planci]
MQRRFSNQPSALDRAQQHLQGKRLSAPTGPNRGQGASAERKKDDDDLNAYLSKLNRKVSQATGKLTEGALSDDLSDLSLSSDELGGRGGRPSLSASRFVKTSRSQTLENSDTLRRKQETLSGGSPAASSLKKSATMPGFLNRSVPVYASAALQKAARLGAKFAEQRRSAENLRDTESDLDILLSDDSGKDCRPLEGGASRGVSRGGGKAKLPTGNTDKATPLGHQLSSDNGEPKRAISKFLKKSARPSFYVGESDDQDDSDFGRDGNKFLKKSAALRQPSNNQSKTDAEEGTGSRFLKKPAKQGQPDDAKSTTTKMRANDDTSLPRGRRGDFMTSTPKKNGITGASKLSRTAPSAFRLDSDEEDLQDFIMNLSPTSSPEIPPIRDNQPRKKSKDTKESQPPSAVKSTPVPRPATPAAKTVTASRDADSLSADSVVADESVPSVAESIDGEEEGNLFSGIHANIMQLEDLESIGNAATLTSSPASKTKPSAGEKYDSISDEISEHSSFKKDIFAGLQTVDDLLFREMTPKRDGKHRTGKDSEHVSADEIDTEGEYSISEVLSEGTLRRSGSKTPGEVYADDTFVSGTESPSAAGTSTRTVPDSHSEVTSEEDTRRQMSIHSQQPDSVTRSTATKTSRSYSDDFHSHGTDSDMEDFSTDEDSRTRTESVTHSQSFTSYTESRTVTRSERTPRKGRRRERRKERSKDAAVQADGATSATHRWLRDLDLSALGTVTGVDPLPVAMHIINPQALEALTSYSPSILAMNETLLSQLRHTRESINSTLRLHQSLAESIETDYSYTTLEDTKEYIHRHRRPKLTMEQALAEVRQEMEEGYR